MPQLDVLRGIAVLLVFACHTALHLGASPLRELACKGWTGVDLFFALSGFLITQILIQNRDSQNYFQIFYIRRALRIWPLYFGLLALSFGVFPAISATAREQAAVAGPGWIYALFLQNVLPHMRPATLVVTWSLAVEEQFYLLWSLIIFGVSIKHLRWAFAALLIFSPAVRWLAFREGIAPDFVYFNIFHNDALVAGSLVALFTFRQHRSAVLAQAGIATLALGGVIITFAGVPASIENIRNIFTYSGIAMAWSGLLILALAIPNNKAIRWWEPLRATGKISYCLYLVHYPILSTAFLARTRFRLTSYISTGCLIACSLIISYAVSICSWIYIERPVLRLKSRYEYEFLFESAAA